MLSSFLHDRSGSVAILFGAMVIVFLGVAGLGIDHARSQQRRADVQNALDAAVIAGANASGDQVAAAEKLFAAALKFNAPGLDPASVNTQFTPHASGGLVGEATMSVSTLFMKHLGASDVDVSVRATAAFDAVDNSGKSCVYLTDPRNTGLGMTDNSTFTTDCVIQIFTSGTAIRVQDAASAEFEDICATGRIEAAAGAVTPNAPAAGCAPVADPLAGLTAPSIASGGCTSPGDITVASGASETLAEGKHCGMITVQSGGVLELDPGVHVFRGGLDLNAGGSMTGDDVLLTFVRENNAYRLDGALNVSGLTSGDYAGFVLFHEDFGGYSNSIFIGPLANFQAEGVIYLPNTNLKIQSTANEFATRSLLITDRFELSGDARFRAVVSETSSVPIPDLLGGEDVRTPRLIK